MTQQREKRDGHLSNDHWNRPPDRLGVCYEGGLDEKGRPADTRTPAQKLTLHTLLVSLKADFPEAEIMGHCELEGVHKDCPCFPVSTIRAQMKQLGY